MPCALAMVALLVSTHASRGQDRLEALPTLPIRQPNTLATPPPLPDAIPLAPSQPSFIESLTTPTSSIEVKVGQGRFLTLKENLVVPGQQAALIAVGDPTVLDFFQAGPRQLRLLGKRLGTTDLSITTGAGKTYDYEVTVTADLDILRAQLRQMYPDASLQVAQLRERLVVEGQARDSVQVSRIISTIDTYIRSIQRVQISGQIDNVQVKADGAPAGPANAPRTTEDQPPPPPSPGSSVSSLMNDASANFSSGGPQSGNQQVSPGATTTNQIVTNQLQIINLIRVPTSQQVLLKVRVAELNRTGFRQIGADFLASIPQFGSLFGTQISGGTFVPGRLGNTTFRPPAGATPDVRAMSVAAQGTVFGTFSQGQFNTVLSALRRNNLLKVLAEPNLIALNGHQANFLAGGEFPVPVLQGSSGSTGGGNSISVQFKEFGVRLAFLPLIQDNETIRMTIDPEVSTIDTTLGTTLVPGGTPIPGLNTRKSHTTVELKQGDTLAIAGLMLVSIDGSTQRIPGLGDLPYIGAFFSNTTSQRIEKELVVLVTPYIIEPMTPSQVPPLPGDEINEPNDLEFYLMNRIEGRTGIDARSTTSFDDPLHLIRHSIVERKFLVGPSGYSK